MTIRLAALIVELFLSAGLLRAQDTLSWFSDMNRRMEELTRREMSWRPTLLVTDDGENWQPVHTVEDAIYYLCIHDLSLAQEISLYDFLDSAATELWQLGTPVLLSTCHHIIHPERLLAEERANGYQNVCVAILCSPGRRPNDGIEIFNHRTRLLLQASAPLKAAEVLVGRKRLTVGCDTAQAIDRTDLKALQEWTDHWDSLMFRMPDEMLTQGAPKREVREVIQEQRQWVKARDGHCTALAHGLPESLREARQLSCMEWAGRCRVVEMTQTFHRIVPKMWYRDGY